MQCHLRSLHTLSSLVIVKKMLSLLTRFRSSDFERMFLFKATLEAFCIASSSEGFASWWYLIYWFDEWFLSEASWSSCSIVRRMKDLEYTLHPHCVLALLHAPSSSLQFHVCPFLTLPYKHGNQRFVIPHFLTFLTPSLRLLTYLGLRLSSWCALASCTHHYVFAPPRWL